MRAVIVASGPSAEGFSSPDDVTVIAVNGVISWVDHADYWFSLDASRTNRRWLLEALDRMVPAHVAGKMWSVEPLCHMATHWTRVEGELTYPFDKPRDTPEWNLNRLQGIKGICKTPGHIHTGNSAWGALGLAWHLGFRDVALVGVDATQEPRIEGGTPGNLSHLPLLFASALPDMNVVSCGYMGGIPQMSFKDWYENR